MHFIAVCIAGSPTVSYCTTPNQLSRSDNLVIHSPELDRFMRLIKFLGIIACVATGYMDGPVGNQSAGAHQDWRQGRQASSPDNHIVFVTKLVRGGESVLSVASRATKS